MQITAQQYIPLDEALNEKADHMDVEYWVRDDNDEEETPNAVKLGDLILNAEDILKIADTVRFLSEQGS